MMKMGVNLYKIRYVLEFIRRQGRLPTDERGQVLSPYDMLAWFGLTWIFHVVCLLVSCAKPNCLYSKG